MNIWNVCFAASHLTRRISAGWSLSSPILASGTRVDPLPPVVSVRFKGEKTIDSTACRWTDGICADLLEGIGIKFPQKKHAWADVCDILQLRKRFAGLSDISHGHLRPAQVYISIV